jgi:protein-disulfide isomerase
LRAYLPRPPALAWRPRLLVDLRRYAAHLGLDPAAFDQDRAGPAVAGRIRRDFRSGLDSGQVLRTPTLFIDGIVHRGGYDPPPCSPA